MIFDNNLMFSDAQAVTATAASTNTIDLGATGRVLGDTNGVKRDVGKGEDVKLLVQVVEAFDSAANDGTLKIDLELDSTETFTPDTSITLGTFTEAQLVAGFQTPFDDLPKGTDLRYARLKYTVGGSGNFTAGKITAGIVMGIQTA